MIPANKTQVLGWVPRLYGGLLAISISVYEDGGENVSDGKTRISDLNSELYAGFGQHNMLCLLHGHCVG